MYYHATNMDNLGSIMREGIKPSRYEHIVYLADTFLDAVGFVMLRGWKKILVLPCDVDGLEETYDHSYEFFRCKAYRYDGVIGPELINWEDVRVYLNPCACDT